MDVIIELPDISSGSLISLKWMDCATEEKRQIKLLIESSSRKRSAGVMQQRVGGGYMKITTNFCDRENKDCEGRIRVQTFSNTHISLSGW